MYGMETKYRKLFNREDASREKQTKLLDMHCILVNLVFAFLEPPIDTDFSKNCPVFFLV